MINKDHIENLEKTKYTLLNGDKVEVGKCYRTRDGRKAFVTEVAGVIVGTIEHETIMHSWGERGNFGSIYNKVFDNSDLIALWESTYDQCADE